MATHNPELEKLLGRSLDDDQRSRHYDLERQCTQDIGRMMSGQHLMLIHPAAMPSHPPSGGTTSSDKIKKD